MFRNLVCAGFFLAVSIGLVAAEEFTASIRKVEDGKVTFTKFTKKDGKFEKGDETTLPVASDVKVVKGKFTEDKKVEAGEAIPDGLKNERFKDISEKGVFARIITDDGGKTITEIRLLQFKKKKDN
jgi:hypothetical protein